MQRCRIAVCALSWLLASPAAAQKPPKVLVSVDMEGIWGVVASEQVNGTSPEYTAGRRWMAEDVNAAIAAYYKVPVILLTGDSETCRMASALLGDSVVTAAVKDGIGRTAARMVPVEEARKRLRDAAREALAKRSRIEPFRLAGPYTFEVDFHSAGQAELPSLLPNVKRANPRGVSFMSADYIEAFKLLRAIIALAGVS
jgi:D-amino peptidase